MVSTRGNLTSQRVQVGHSPQNILPKLLKDTLTYLWLLRWRFPITSTDIFRIDFSSDTSSSYQEKSNKGGTYPAGGTGNSDYGYVIGGLSGGLSPSYQSDGTS